MSKDILTYIKWDGNKGVVIAGPYTGRLVRLRYDDLPAPQEYFNCQILMDSGWVTVLRTHDSVINVEYIELYMNRWFRGFPHDALAIQEIYRLLDVGKGSQAGNQKTV